MKKFILEKIILKKCILKKCILKKCILDIKYLYANIKNNKEVFHYI